MRISGSPFGQLSGKSGGLVASTWKGQAYTRAHVIPANPTTAGRTANKLLFKLITQFFRRIVDTVLNPYTLPKPKRMSAYNEAVSKNQKANKGVAFDIANMKIVQGSLYNPGITSVIIVSGVSIVINWATTLIGEALGNDLAQIVIYDEATDAFEFTSAIRSAGTKSHTTTLQVVAEKTIHVWLFFADAALTRTSESDHTGKLGEGD